MQSRDEIAEQVVALAGSVSNEKAAKMRALVELARKEGADGANAREAWSEIVDSQVRARIAALEREASVLRAEDAGILDRISAVEERVSALERATTNTGDGSKPQAGAEPHSDAHYDNPVNGGGAAAFSPSVKAGTAHQGSPSPASPAPEIPSWVPSAEEIVHASWTQFEPDRTTPPGPLAIKCAEAVRRLIASRAPHPSPLSVEEMAERLKARMVPWVACGEVGGLTDGMYRALARTALSAFPALAALVEAGDAMRELTWKYRSDLAVERAVNAYDRARAALEGKDERNG